jgi:peroxiredoxin
LNVARDRPHLQPGDRAPGFTLPAADREGEISLGEYHGHTPVFLALFRGLYCPFCRRQLTQLNRTAGWLTGRGIPTLAVVATPAERARQYFRYRPLRFPVAADPDLNTHHAYGFWERPFTPRLEQMAEEAALDFAREVGLSARLGRASEAIRTFDGFEAVESDQRDFDRQQAMVIGQLLIDREGLVRWINVEHRAGVLPSEQQLTEAIAAL